LLIQELKLKSQTTRASNTQKIEKKTPLPFLGRWGRSKRK
jgi:hypothetical protein